MRNDGSGLNKYERSPTTQSTLALLEGYMFESIQG